MNGENLKLLKVPFEQMKQTLGCGWCHSNEKVEMAVHELLWMREPIFYNDGIIKPFKTKRISIM